MADSRKKAHSVIHKLSTKRRVAEILIKTSPVYNCSVPLSLGGAVHRVASSIFTYRPCRKIFDIYIQESNKLKRVFLFIESDTEIFLTSILVLENPNAVA